MEIRQWLERNSIVLKVMRKPHSLAEAETSRDSFSKALYDRLFTWIVGHVNAAIDPALTEAAADDPVNV